jgi:hypothetical protein
MAKSLFIPQPTISLSSFFDSESVIAANDATKSNTNTNTTNQYDKKKEQNQYENEIENEDVEENIGEYEQNHELYDMDTFQSHILDKMPVSDIKMYPHKPPNWLLKYPHHYPCGESYLNHIKEFFERLPIHVQHALRRHPFESKPGFETPYFKDVPHDELPEKMYLDHIHAHDEDRKVVFVDSKTRPHIYFIDDGHEFSCRHMMSVTGLIHTFFKPFDPEAHSKRMAAKSRQVKPQYKHCKVPQDFKDVWDKNSMLGSALHKRIELYYNLIPLYDLPGDDDNQVTWQYFLNWDHDTKERCENWRPWRTEWSIFDPELRLAGQIDMVYLLYNQYGEVDGIAIIDWKRAEEFANCNFWRKIGQPQNIERGIGPCEYLDDCNFNHYSLQLNLYACILERRYGITVRRMKLVQFYPNQPNYVEVSVCLLKSKAALMLELRRYALSLPEVTSSHPMCCICKHLDFSEQD